MSTQEMVLIEYKLNQHLVRQIKSWVIPLSDKNCSGQVWSNINFWIDIVDVVVPSNAIASQWQILVFSDSQYVLVFLRSGIARFDYNLLAIKS